MKARVKYNNEIIDVVQVGTKTHLFDLNNVEFLDNQQDYWTRLEHQAAIAAMQGKMAQGDNFGNSREDVCNKIADYCIDVAYTLIKQLKEKEERK